MLFILIVRVEPANYLKIFFYHTTLDNHMQFALSSESFEVI